MLSSQLGNIKAEKGVQEKKKKVPMYNYYSWIRGWNELLIECFECLKCMRFVFWHLHLFSTVEHVSHGKAL